MLKKRIKVFNEEAFWARVESVISYMKLEWDGCVAPVEKTQYKHPSHLKTKPQPNIHQRSVDIVEWVADLERAAELRIFDDARVALNRITRCIKL